jgi:hypothetical protein
MEAIEMDFSDEQKNAVKGWVEEGLTLSDIQKKLSGQFELTMTYMDVRFLVLDLGLAVQDRVERAEPKADAEAGGQGAADGQIGGLALEVDRIMKPGSVVSGTVVFSDGVSATWFVDQAGRLALDSGQEGYRPSEEDMASFQESLKSALAKRGF